MPTLFYPTPDNASTTTTGYTAAAGSLSLASGAGSQFGSTFPVLVSTFLADGTPQGVYQVTGRTGDTLTGLTLVAGTDSTLPAGSLVQVAWTAEHVAQHTAAINALETAVALKAPLAAPTFTGTVTAAGGSVLVSPTGPNGRAYVYLGGSDSGHAAVFNVGPDVYFQTADLAGPADLHAGSVTATGNISTTGAVSQFGVNRRDTNAQAGAIYSGAGELNFYVNGYGVALTMNADGTATLAGGVRNSSGPALPLRGLSSTAAARDVGYLDAGFVVTTDATYTGYARLCAQDHNATAGGREGVRVASDGTQALLGFYGATAVAKAASPGTATGADAAVINAAVTILRNLGLCS